MIASAFPLSDTLLAGLIGGLAAGLAVYFQQRNRRQDKDDAAILSQSESASALAVAAINQWRDIVTAQGTVQAEQVKEINKLRERAEKCEEQGRVQGRELERLKLRLERAGINDVD